MLLVGGAPRWLGRSAWLMTVAGRDEGAPPPVDLAAERLNGAFVASLIRDGRVSAVHDLSDGGLAVALAEMAMAGGVGATIAAEGPEHAFFFGEDQGRYVLTAAPAEAAAIAEEGETAWRSLPQDRRYGRRGFEARRRAAGHACGAHKSARELACRIIWTGLKGKNA